MVLFMTDLQCVKQFLEHYAEQNLYKFTNLAIFHDAGRVY